MFEEIDRNQKEHIGFLRALIKEQTKGEEALQSLIAERFEEIGFQTEIIKSRPSSIKMDHEFAAEEEINDIERITVVGTHHGSGDGKSLLIYGHPDSEPITTTEDWTRNPFSAVIEGDRLYGYGVADDLEGIAIMTESLAALRNAGINPGGDVHIGSATTKQNARGIIALLDKGYKADACIYLHPEETGVGMREFQNITPGILNFRVGVLGIEPDTRNPGKTAFSHLGVNAIDKGILVVEALKALDLERGERVSFEMFNDKVGRSTNLIVTKFKGAGDVPTECLIEASISFPPTEKLQDIKNDSKQCITIAARTDSWLSKNPPTISWLFGGEGMDLSINHPICKTVIESIETVTGEKPVSNPMHAVSSIYNPYLYSGIPSIAYGPLCGNLTQNGLHDEWVDLPDFVRAIKVTSKVISNWTK